MNPFHIIKDPEAVNKILVTHNYAELHSEIKGDGYAFCPIEGRHNWGLVVCHKDKAGKASYRIVSCLKIVSAELWCITMTEIMVYFSEKNGWPLSYKEEKVSEVMQRN